jgi:plasmid stabilization system protein ParE
MHALLKHPLLDCDLEESALWYAQRNSAVAERLIDAAQAAMRAAAEKPYQFPIFCEDIRRCRLHRFPHAIYFLVIDDSVHILALIHGARDVLKVLAERRPPISD